MPKGDAGTVPHVKRSALLEAVELEDVRALIASGMPRAYERGSVLFQRGERADGLLLIVSGEARVSLDSADGSAVTLAVLGPGDIVGDLALLDGADRSATVSASAALRGLYVSADGFEAWLRERPRALRAIAGGLARRVRRTDEHVAGIALLSAHDRVRRFLAERFEEAAGGAVAGARVRLKQAEAAEALGLRRETLNRELRRLRERGTIADDRRELVLLEPRALLDAVAL